MFVKVKETLCSGRELHMCNLKEMDVDLGCECGEAEEDSENSSKRPHIGEDEWPNLKVNKMLVICLFLFTYLFYCASILK